MKDLKAKIKHLKRKNSELRKKHIKMVNKNTELIERLLEKEKAVTNRDLELVEIKNRIDRIVGL